MSCSRRGKPSLHDIAMGVLHLQERQRTALFARKDPFGRFVSCMVYVPRERFDTALRRRIQALLEEAYKGTTENYSTRLTDATLARVHFIVVSENERVPKVDVAALESRLAEASRSFVDHLEDALIATHGEIKGLRSLRRFERAFPGGLPGDLQRGRRRSKISHVSSMRWKAAISP